MTRHRFTRHAFTRRAFLEAGALAASATILSGCAGRSMKARTPLIDARSLAFLRELALATIESARVRPGESRSGAGPA